MSVYTFRFKAAVTSGNGVLGYGSVRSSSPLHDCAHILPTCAKRTIVMNRFGQATYMYISTEILLDYTCLRCYYICCICRTKTSQIQQLQDTLRIYSTKLATAAIIIPNK